MISKVIPLSTSEMSGHARIASGAIASCDTLVSSEFSSANLTGVDISRMVSTTSWCCPSMNSSTQDSNGHGVFGVDTFDIAPAKTVSTDGVNDFNSIVVNNDFGAMQNQVETTTYYATNASSNYGCCGFAAVDSLNDKASNQEVHNPGSNNAATGSKSLSVHHVASLTQGVKNV
jgi:hypothetical protein